MSDNVNTLSDIVEVMSDKVYNLLTYILFLKNSHQSRFCFKVQEAQEAGMRPANGIAFANKNRRALLVHAGD